MKKLIITAVITTMFSVAAFADGGKKAITTGEENVSSYVLDQFKSTFKNADNIVWSVSESCQKVKFIDNKITYTAFYSTEGDYLGIAHNVDFNTLTDAVLTKIGDTYKDYEISKVIKYETKEGDQLVYSVHIKTADTDAIVKATADAPVVYFVNLKSATDEVMVKVTPDNELVPFKS